MIPVANNMTTMAITTMIMIQLQMKERKEERWLSHAALQGWNKKSCHYALHTIASFEWTFDTQWPGVHPHWLPRHSLQLVWLETRFDPTILPVVRWAGRNPRTFDAIQPPTVLVSTHLGTFQPLWHTSSCTEQKDGNEIPRWIEFSWERSRAYLLDLIVHSSC